MSKKPWNVGKSRAELVANFFALPPQEQRETLDSFFRMVEDKETELVALREYFDATATLGNEIGKALVEKGIWMERPAHQPEDN